MTVTPLRSEAEKKKEACVARWTAFDALVTAWMDAYVQCDRAEGDDAIDKAMDRKDECFWKIVRERGCLPRHAQDKFNIMLIDMGDDRLFRNYAAMIESIRADIDYGWDSTDPA